MTATRFDCALGHGFRRGTGKVAGSMTAPPIPTLLTPRILIPFLIVTLIWGSTWLVIRDQLGSVPPSWSVTYRFAVASIGMFALAIIQRRPLGLSWQAQCFAALIGVFQFGVNFNFVYRAEIYLTSGLVAVLFALLIVPNVLLSRLFLGTRSSSRFVAGVLVALIGVALMVTHEARLSGEDTGFVLFGLLLTFGGIMGASISNVMQATSFAKAQDIIVFLAWAMFWGAIGDAALAWVTVGPPVWDPRPAYLGGILFLGLLGSVVTFPLYFGIIRAVGAGPAAWSSVLIPVIAMALSTLFEGYQWTWLAAGGAALVLAGLIVALKPAGGQAAD
jgi:drug/metabolite transporter (DMT)-like permease